MQRFVRVILATAAIAAALGLGVPTAAADETADAFEDALAAWHPADVDPSASAGKLTEFGADALAGCESGSLREWTLDSGAVARLFWIDCGSPAAAVDRLSAEWSDYYYVPAPTVTPAFGENVELIARYTIDMDPPLLYRMWAQGPHFVGVGRACEDDDVACEEANARDAQSIAALAPAALSELPPPELAGNDPMSGFVPSDDGTWAVRWSSPTDTTVQGENARCGDGRATQFVDTRGETVKVFWVECPTLARAQELAVDYWSGWDSSGLVPVYGSAYDGVVRDGTPDVTTIYRWWLQGTRYVQVEQSCADGDEARCAERTAEYEQAIVAMLPGQLQILTDWRKALWALVVLLGVPIATYLVILIPRGIIARHRQREVDPASEPDASARYISVDTIVQRARTGRIVRRIILVVVGTTISLLVVWWALFSGQFAIQVIGLFVAPIAVFFLVSGLLDLLWKPNRLVRPPHRRGRPSARGLAGALLRGLAVLIAVSTLVLYLFIVLFMWFNGLQSEAAFRAQIEQTLAQADGLARFFPQVLLWLQDLRRTGWVVMIFFAMVALPIFLAYLLDRLGKRLARRSLQETLAQDDRPYFLYLRGFDEDQLRIDESLGRRGFLEVFSPFGRPRFEEVLAEQLSGWGPVIAISGAKQRLADLGAAKISLGGNQWQAKVQEWVRGARAIVLSATPREVRDGLKWEIEHLATIDDAPAVILVISPWPRAERQRRWSGFLDSAAKWPMFQQLVTRRAPSATSILTYSTTRGWTAYGATRRWDWSYAASLRIAIQRGDLEDIANTPDAPGTQPSPAEREPEPV